MACFGIKPCARGMIHVQEYQMASYMYMASFFSSHMKKDCINTRSISIPCCQVAAYSAYVVITIQYSQITTHKLRPLYVWACIAGPIRGIKETEAQTSRCWHVACYVVTCGLWSCCKHAGRAHTTHPLLHPHAMHDYCTSTGKSSSSFSQRCPGAGG